MCTWMLQCKTTYMKCQVENRHFVQCRKHPRHTHSPVQRLQYLRLVVQPPTTIPIPSTPPPTPQPQSLTRATYTGHCPSLQIIHTSIAPTDHYTCFTSTPNHNDHNTGLAWWSSPPIPPPQPPHPPKKKNSHTSTLNSH